MAKDLLMGAFDNYSWSQLKYWVNSINQSGFTGDKVVIVFNASYVTVEKLVENGCMVVACEKGEFGYTHKSTMPIHTERFFHFFNVLKDHGWKYNRVILTDMRDVVFQKNPSDWLDNWMISDKSVLAATECLKYKDEDWGNLNLMQTLGPYFHDYFQHNEIYNVGVIAGDSLWIKDLCLNLFLMAVNRTQPICDQAVYNAMLATRFYQKAVEFTSLSRGWCANLGTVMDPTKIDKFRPFLTEEVPLIIKNDLLQIEGNDCPDEPFTIVHQWDRVPELKEIYEKRYG